MFKLKYKLIIILILTCLLTGCSSQTNITDGGQRSKDFERYNEVITKTGVIPENLSIIGVKDQNNFYCFMGDNRQVVYLYHVSDEITSKVSTVISPDKYIKAITFNEKWMVWTEDEAKIEGDKTGDINWTSYAKNIITGEVFEIDRYKENVKPSSAAFYQAIEPKEFSIYGDYLVYDSYDLEDGVTVQTIKMYDLDKREMCFVDYNKDYQNSFYSHPKIYGNYITWSQSQVNLNDNSEKGSTYLYNISEKERNKITEGEEILWPYIYGNYIVARVKPNGQNDNSCLTLYNIDSNKDWLTIVSPNNSFYQDSSHIEVGMVMMNGQYLIWRDNINSQVIVCDYVSKKFYRIAYEEKTQKDISIIYLPEGIYNKIIFWTEIRCNINDSQEKTIVKKYVVLK